MPERARVKDGFEAFEVMVTLPVAALAAGGAKVTSKDVFCPAASVIGVEIPPSVKPVPLTAICEIVTGEPPVLVTVPDCC